MPLVATDCYLYDPTLPWIPSPRDTPGTGSVFPKSPFSLPKIRPWPSTPRHQTPEPDQPKVPPASNPDRDQPNIKPGMCNTRNNRRNRKRTNMDQSEVTTNEESETGKVNESSQKFCIQS